MKFCSNGLQERTIEDEEITKRVERLNSIYSKYRGRNNKYAAKFFLCEILNLINVIFQIFYIDRFIGGKFLDYGSRIFEYNRHMGTGSDPMDDVFPKMTKCQFNRHGPGGDINNHDALCLLPLNIVNEKIYLVMWIWLIMLAVASSVAVLYRVVCVMFPKFRAYILWNQNTWAVVSDICSNGLYGDWFLLRQLSKNVDPETFSVFLKQLDKQMHLWDSPRAKARPSLKLEFPTIPWVGGFFRPESETEKNISKGFEAEETDSDSFTMKIPNAGVEPVK